MCRCWNALGFTVDQKLKDWVSYEAPSRSGEVTEFFGFTHDPNHKPNGNRIAFWAETREEVDRIAEVARTAGAKNIEGPELYEEPNYYAVFFEDPEGNKLEVCCRAVSNCRASAPLAIPQPNDDNRRGCPTKAIHAERSGCPTLSVEDGSRCCTAIHPIPQPTLLAPDSLACTPIWLVRIRPISISGRNILSAIPNVATGAVALQGLVASSV